MTIIFFYSYIASKRWQPNMIPEILFSTVMGQEKFPKLVFLHAILHNIGSHACVHTENPDCKWDDLFSVKSTSIFFIHCKKYTVKITLEWLLQYAVISVACLLRTCDILQNSRPCTNPILNQSVVEKLLSLLISISFRRLSYSIFGEVGISLILQICPRRSALVV